MVKVKDLGPLDWRIGIVDKAGRPTPEFQRKWDAQRNNNALIGTITFGSGAPTSIPEDGAEYVDTTATPPVLYIGENSAWLRIGIFKFIQLSDVPNSYSAAGSKILRVNSGATAVEFAAVSGVLDGLGSTQGDVLYRGASGWAALAPGTAGNVLTTGGAGANPTWASGGGGGGGVPPTVRGSGIQASSAASYTVSWPAGTLAGDLALIFIGAGFQISGAPTGWALLDQKTGANWNGSTLFKILTSADITAGNVVVSMSGTFDSVLAIITFVGGAAGVYGSIGLQNSTAVSSRSIISNAYIPGVTGIYFGSNRSAGLVTIDQGSVLQAANDGSAATGALYAGSPPPNGITTFSYASVGIGGDYQFLALVVGP